MKTGIKNHMALFHVLHKLKNFERQIILDHLDSTACDSLSNCIKIVLKKKKKLSPAQKAKVKKIISDHRQTFDNVLNKKRKRKRDLAKLGGFPFAFLLSTAIPLLINLLKKK